MAKTVKSTSFGFRNLVFEGGGVKGIAYGGALEELQKLGMLDHLQRVAGTSAGAINACTLALGCTPAQVGELISTTNFADFQDGNGLIGNAVRMFNKFGWYKGDDFMDWIGEVVKKQTGTKDFTFGDLDDAIKGGNTAFKYLYMAVTNLSEQKAEVFSHEAEAHKSIPVRRVVRMSMSLPVFFAAFKNGNNVMVDGGVSYNYPVNLFDKPEYVSNPVNSLAGKDGSILNMETLGFRLDSKDVITYAKRDWATPPADVKNLKTYAVALLDFMMEAANKAHLQGEDWNRTVFIDTLDVRTSDFSLPAHKIEELTKSGTRAVKDYFDWRFIKAESPWKDHPVV
ncbi:MAG: patatin-like phospholipase family protein [Imperialibacter sp.]|uniref:patatin-like phospholipase family protein n=1 Tax=Imperialibacter sp. TaxID=2038411 RepID=UPI003A8A6EEE